MHMPDAYTRISYMHTCIYVYRYGHIDIFACVYICTQIHRYVYAHIPIYVCTDIHTKIHVAELHMRIRMYI